MESGPREDEPDSPHLPDRQSIGSLLVLARRLLPVAGPLGIGFLLTSHARAEPTHAFEATQPAPKPGETALSPHQSPNVTGGRTAIGLAALDRPTGIVEFGFGWLTLPGASICVVPLRGCREGDTSFEVDAWQLYRGSTRIAFGAGVLFGLIPTTDATSEAFDRDHSRQYLTIEGTVRYYPYVGLNVEWWLGLTGGLVVVSDRFEVASPAPDRALLGPRGVTLRTEGGSLGIAGGPVFALTPNWALGATLRYGQWFLPSRPEFDAAGSRASLAGRNTVLSLGVAIAFRMAL